MSKTKKYYTYEDVDEKITEYDQRRKIRKVVTGKQEICLQDFNSSLTCPVCLGIIHNATTVMECLHRFCSNCIETALRLGSKNCPSCRVPCPSRRNLRKDRVFDELIGVFYPDLEQADAQQAAMVQQILESRNTQHAAFAATVRAKQNIQSQAKKDKEQRSGSNGSSDRKVNHSEIEFCLRPAESEDSSLQLAKQFLRTSRQITISHLCKFLAKKLGTNDPDMFEIYVADTCDGHVPDDADPLPDSTTLSEVDDEYETATFWPTPPPNSKNKKGQSKKGEGIELLALAYKIKS